MPAASIPQRNSIGKTKTLHFVHDLTGEESPRVSRKRKNEAEERPPSAAETDARRTKSRKIVFEPSFSHGSVQRELVLRDGAMQLKPLRALFGITRASSSRRQKFFRQIVKDLCFLKLDRDGGMFLVLKSLRDSPQQQSPPSSSQRKIQPMIVPSMDHPLVEDDEEEKLEEARKAKIERFKAFRERAKIEAKAKDDAHFNDSGQRILSEETVRRQIVLNHGSLKLTELKEFFSLHEDDPSTDKLKTFDKIIKTLCHVRQDASEGIIVFLRQQYSKMR